MIILPSLQSVCPDFKILKAVCRLLVPYFDMIVPGSCQPPPSALISETLA